MTHSQEQDPCHHHKHVHSDREKRAVINRIARAIGHLESIKHMVEEDQDCSEILVQISAVKAAIHNTGKIVLQNHLEHCVADAILEGDEQYVKEFIKNIDFFLK